MTGHVAVRRFPTLTVSTPRVYIRPLVAADADAVAVVFADKLTRRWRPLSPVQSVIDPAPGGCGAGDDFRAPP